MNTTKKIAVVLAVMMVAAAMAAPAAMGVDYSATVLSGQNTAITASNGALGSGKAGTTLTTIGSIELTNEGNDAATVSAKFTTDCNDDGTGSDFGLDDVQGTGTGAATNCIAASNFRLGDTTLDALNNDGTPKTLTDGVPANSVVTYDAELDIPVGQAAASYYGTVELNFA